MTNAELTSKEKFIEDISTLVNAAIGVIIVRTREPYEVMTALREYSLSTKWQFNRWSITTGFLKFPMTDAAAEPIKVDNTQPPGAAIKYVGDTQDNNNYKQIYAMMWSHFYSKRDNPMPEFIQHMADYTKLFANKTKRLIMVVPPEYQVPPELQDSVVIVDTDLPTQTELRELYDDVMDQINSMGKKAIDYTDEEVERIIAAGAGMTLAEFDNTLSRALRKFRKELPDIAVDTFVREISKTKAELVKRSEVLELMPLGNMEEVGGLENLKEWISVRRYAYDAEAREFGVDQPRGVALIGPPGTGKSLCAKAIAHELGLPLIRFDVSRVFGSLVGQSEGRVREALKMCDAMAPCVIMLDEVDKAFDVNSGGGDSGVGKRILGAVLTHMQEGGKPIFWVMTANRVGGLPPELLRKGRLDEVFSVTTPSEKEREAIFKIHLKKRKQNPDLKGLEKAVEASNRFVGAEIEAAVAEAVLQAYAKDKPLTAEMLVEQFKDTKPLSEAHKEQFKMMEDWAADNAKASSKEAKARSRERNRVADTSGRGSARVVLTDDLDG